jgi:hypothetical protein
LAAMTISGALKPGILNAVPTTLPAMATFTATAIALKTKTPFVAFISVKPPGL